MQVDGTKAEENVNSQSIELNHQATSLGDDLNLQLQTENPEKEDLITESKLPENVEPPVNNEDLSKPAEPSVSDDILMTEQITQDEPKPLRAAKKPSIRNKAKLDSPVPVVEDQPILANTTTIKRKYTRKVPLKPKPISQAVAVNNEEDVSIVDSSSSSGSEKSSINIMSSSSESGESLTSLSERSAKSKTSKSSTISRKSSLTSLSSVSSSLSVSSNSSSSKSSLSNHSAEVIEEWEKLACASIFSLKKPLKNPDFTFLRLKRKISNILEKDPAVSLEVLISACSSQNSAQSIKEVHAILSKKGMVVKPASISKGKRKNIEDLDEKNLQVSEDFELLKKLSSTSSGRKRKIRSEEGEWIDPEEIEGRVISHEPAVSAVKEKRKRRPVKVEMFSEDGELNSSEDPFRLILLNDFCGHGEANEGDEGDGSMSLPAPFKVEMCSSVILLMDLHSHLHSSEIIGLLGGTFFKSDSDAPAVLRIDHGYPCLTVHSTGTQVDVDPLSEMEAGEYFEGKNVRMAGWYHSHPNFEPNPSLRDLETQTMYQALFRNSQPDSDVEPFVGVIVNPYLALTEASSHVECFYVAPTIGDPSHQERLPYRLPINRVPFSVEHFPILLEQMREIVERARLAPDRLDMLRNAQPGHKRIDKLFGSLQFHGNLTNDQLDQIKQLF
jgi:proteasome lid subunit RPN8/RPN11